MVFHNSAWFGWAVMGICGRGVCCSCTWCPVSINLQCIFFVSCWPLPEKHIAWTPVFVPTHPEAILVERASFDALIHVLCVPVCVFLYVGSLFIEHMPLLPPPSREATRLYGFRSYIGRITPRPSPTPRVLSHCLGPSHPSPSTPPFPLSTCKHILTYELKRGMWSRRFPWQDALMPWDSHELQYTYFFINWLSCNEHLMMMLMTKILSWNK